MTLSTTKSECMHVSWRRNNVSVAPAVWYKGKWLPWTNDFKYLGLQFNHSASAAHMCTQRLKKAKGSYCWLQRQLATKGWWHKRTRLILFDLYVSASLLYGCVVWGSAVVHNECPLQIDMAGNLSTFHRGCLRQLLGIPRKVRNEVVHILAAQPTVQVKIVKQMYRYI
jgi:hypothetical protein